MTKIRSNKWLFILVAILPFTIGTTRAKAGQFDRENPIVATQSKVVAVTPETLNEGEKKQGAPAPSFKILNDTGEFFTELPYEQILKENPNKWSLFDQEETNSDVPSEPTKDDVNLSDTTT